MKKNLNAEQEIESLWIREWCLTIIDFIYSKDKTNANFYETYKETFSENTKHRYLEKLNPSTYIKGLKQAYNDMNEWAYGLSITDVEELNKILQDKFAKDLNTNSHNIPKQISKIIKRGKINNDDEFRMINEKVNEICQTSPKSSELDKLNQLLLKYEQNQK